jgi:hypothetical protein
MARCVYVIIDCKVEAHSAQVFIWQVPENFTLQSDGEEPADVSPVARLSGHMRQAVAEVQVQRHWSLTLAQESRSRPLQPRRRECPC